MKKILIKIGVCLFISIFTLWGLHALDSAMKTNNENLKNYGFSYFEDTSGQLNIEDINTLYLQNQFTKKDTADFSFGRSRSAFWIGINTINTAELKNYIALYCPNIQFAQLYIPTDDGYITYDSGWGNSYIRNDEGLTYPVFPIDQEYSSEQTIYLRVQSEYSHLYSIYFYNQKQLISARIIDYCLNSFLFGILLTIVIINLIICFSLKNKICLLFALCVFLISIHQGCTTGIYNVLLPKHSNIIMQFSIEIGLIYIISTIILFIALLDLKNNNRVYYLCSKVLIVACLICYPICFIDKIIANYFAHLLTIVPAVFIFYASLWLYFKGKMKHPHFIISWNLITLMYIFVIISTEGILHIQNNYITVHATLIIIVIVSIIFTMAMINHAKTVQMEKLKMKQQIQITSEKVKQTEIALMQAQIKPHFLYNTLTAIEQMCQIDSLKAQKAIVDFANYLRSNIDFSAQTGLILIEKELSNVKCYLDLEQMRFEERLNVIYDIKAKGFMLPPLVVQTIVENAVRHGVTKKPQGGTVTISISETVTDYLITVMDNGVGFDTNSDTWKIGHHIGIDNARERLRRQCKGMLKIESLIGIGTTVVITIPKEREI